MLFESDVIDAVCRHLESKGYRIQQQLGVDERGDDIVATKALHPPRELYIEAKGETSSKGETERYGRPFDSAQVRVHVAQAFYKAAEVLGRRRGSAEVRSGLALPYSRLHRKYLEPIEPILCQLGIVVFWVRQDRTVEIVSSWDL